MFFLTPAEKAYAWGSPDAIQAFSGIGTPGDALAEIWYGAHPAGPSTLADGRPLDAVIAGNPEVLGADVAERFGGQLPFLVKLLAPGQAVSLQVHPSAERAREGYAAQQATGDGGATFVDANHKPEQIFALTHFEGLVGLRPLDDAATILTAFDEPVTRRAAEALAAGDAAAIATAVTVLAEASAAEVEAVVARARTLAADDDLPAARTVLELAEQYPGDAGVVVSLMLERVRLEPGESVMVHSGVPHAYMSGLALEVMANSDNVFRLGLTVKQVDVAESVRNLITTPALVSRPHGAATVEGAAEFELTVHTLGASETPLGGSGPRIAIAIAGRCELRDGDTALTLEPGRAAFLPHGSTVAATAAAGQLAVISVPGAAERS